MSWYRLRAGIRNFRNNFFKKDDGWLDVIVKTCGTCAFIFGVYTYFHTIHPVWKKEHELTTIQASLDRVNAEIISKEKERDALHRTIADLKAEVEQKKQREKDALELARNLQEKARQDGEERAKEAAELGRKLFVAETVLERRTSNLVAALLNRYSDAIFNIQIKNIYGSNDKEKLDLKRDILEFAAKELKTAKPNTAESVALKILTQFAEESVEPGGKEYSRVYAVVINSFQTRSRELLAQITVD